MMLPLFLISIVFPFLQSESVADNLEVKRLRRAPAVWGDPAPDYSAVNLGDNPFRYLYALLFVDNKITSHYEYDMLQVKYNILKVVEEANTYFNQLQIGLVVVDILQTMRSDLSLYSFQDYRNQRMLKLPPHDFAALISFRYAGGLAFVEGMCTDKAVMLCGFYPQDPSAMGSIFFHEVAHLVGVPHRPANNSIYVSNCPCTGHEPDSTMGCLKIPGFDHDCTTQQFVNVIYKNKCIRTIPMKTRSEPICGNGVLEEDEQCDCGLQRQCNALNCIPETCLYRLHPAWIWLIVFSLFLTSILLLYFILKNRRYISMLNCFKQQKYKQSGFNNPGTIRNFSTSPFHQRKELPLISMEKQNSIVVLDAPPRSAATIQRPKLPPPPPPPKTTISVEPGTNLYEVPCTRQSIQDDLSWKFEDFEDSDEEVMVSNQLTYSSYRGRPGVPTCPSYPSFSPINRVTVQFHGSGETMETDCRSNNSSSSGLNGTSL